MKTIKIFLASSAELKSDREQFELFVNRKNKQWVSRGVFIELIIWEDFLDAMSQTRLQDEYNKAIRECDLFVMLFCTKVGKYTAEEFETAFGQFKATNKPLIFTYFKDAAISTGSANEDDMLSLWAFQKMLKQLGHFQTVYKNIEGLREHFDNQLDKLADDGLIRFEAKSETNYFYSERKIPHTLTKPPFIPEGFLGRKKEVQDIKDKFFAGNNLLLLVNGEGGIGKTTLASHYYYTYRDEYAHVAWLLSEKNIANALLALAGPLALQFEETMLAAARLDLLLTSMAELRSPCLLVIDNANELDDLETNYLNLRRCHNFHVLLTTRITEFSQAESFKIEGLPEAEALQLFRTHYPEHNQQEDGIFKQIRAAVGGNTLVIELLAKNLHLLNRLKTNYSLASLLADLQHKGVLAIGKSQAVSTGYQTTGSLRKEKPEDIIAAMYDLGQLETAETALLSAFAVLPAESIAFKMVETLLASTENLEQNLLGLAQKGWIEYNKNTASFKCSPVVQEIAKKKNLQLFKNCATLISTLTEKLYYEGGTGHFLNATYEGAAAFTHYAESLVAAFSETKNEIAILCERIGNYHSTTGNLSKALEYFEQYTRLEKELYDAYSNNVFCKNELAISYSKLGETHTALGNLSKALEYFEQYTCLEKELYDAYPNNVGFKNGLAPAICWLGITHTSLGNLEKALPFFVQYNQLEKELYDAYPNNVGFKNGLAISCSKLGETHTALGNLDKALEYFEQYTRLEKELYDAYPNSVGFKNGLAISYSRLGETHTALGNLDKALEYFEQYTRLEKELYDAYPNNVGFKNGLASAICWLGITHTSLGNLEKALPFFIQYNQLEKELYDAYPNNVGFKNGLAISCCKLGETHTALGNLSKALEYFEQFTRLEKELYDAYSNNVDFKNGLAISCCKLGETHTALGNLRKALEYFEQYTRLEKELYDAYSNNVGFKNGLALSYQRLGWAYEKVENKTRAIEYYKLSAELLSQLVKSSPQQVQFKKNLGWVQNKLSEK